MDHLCLIFSIVIPKQDSVHVLIMVSVGKSVTVASQVFTPTLNAGHAIVLGTLRHVIQSQGLASIAKNTLSEIIVKSKL